MANLDRFFSPHSVAVIGASQGDEKIGGRALLTLLKHGYAGKVYPVNPTAAEIAGLKSYKTIADVPDPVDLAVIAVPALRVPDVLQACADAGVKGAVILSSGFNEAGDAGKALQQRLKDIVARSAMRVCGPNTEGYFNVCDSVAATFNVAIDIAKGDIHSAAQIGIVSQSGGLGFAFYNKGRRDNLNFSHIVSVGNQVDLDIADYAAWMIEQPCVKVLLMYVESINRPEHFLRMARRAAELAKPIVMVKVGHSAAGQRAAQSHTGALTSPAAVVDAALAHHGIVRADDQDALLTYAAAFVTNAAAFVTNAAAFVNNPLPKGQPGNRVGILSVSGGCAAWLADACSAAGLEVPLLDAERRARIAKIIPDFGAPNNPVDVTAQGGEGLAEALDIMGHAPNIDAVMMAVNFSTPRRLLKQGKAIAELVHNLGKPVLIYSYALPGEASLKMLSELGLHVYTSLQGCVRALRAMVDYAAFQHTRAAREAPARTASDMPEAARKLLAAPGKVLCEYEAKALLAAYGVRIPAEALARSADEAVAHAQRLGFPVALKIQSPEIAHKTEARGVALGLQNASAVREAFQAVTGNARTHNANADIHGVLVQKMAQPGRELIAGIVNNSDFGPMVMVGLGGIYTEVLDDTVIAPAPLTHATARDMLTRLRGHRLLTGVRGEAPRDVDAVADLLVRLSHLAWDARKILAEFDVNPVLLHEAGAGLTVVDALAVKKLN